MIGTKLTAGSRGTAVAFCLVMVAAAASAAVFDIPNGDVAALKNAIVAANSNNQNDIINLAPGGDYVLTTVDHTTNGPTGLPAFRADSGNLVTINGNGAALVRSSANGTPEFRVLELSPKADLTLRNLIVSNGRLISPPEGGAGIANLEGRLTLVSCTLSGNNAGASGGGVANAAFDPQGISRLIASNCTFSGNTASSGGGVMNQSSGNLGMGGIATATFSSCTFSGNSASHPQFGASIDSFGADGGEASVSVANSIFEAPPGNQNFSSFGASFTSQGYNLSNDAAGGDGATGPGGS